jgi:hypothetical protein
MPQNVVEIFESYKKKQQESKTIKSLIGTLEAPEKFGILKSSLVKT